MPSVPWGLFPNYSPSLTYKQTNAVGLILEKQAWERRRWGPRCGSAGHGLGGSQRLRGERQLRPGAFPCPFPLLGARAEFLLRGSRWKCVLFRDRDAANSCPNQAFISCRASVGEAKPPLFLLRAERERGAAGSRARAWPVLRSVPGHWLRCPLIAGIRQAIFITSGNFYYIGQFLLFKFLW